MAAPNLSADDSGLARPVATRLRNYRIAAAAQQHRFDRSIAVPFICECGDDRCDELVRLTLPEYALLRDACDYLVAPGHQIEGGQIMRVKENVWLYRAEEGE